MKEYPQTYVYNVAQQITVFNLKKFQYHAKRMVLMMIYTQGTY